MNGCINKEIKICRFDQQIMLGRALRRGVELCSNQLIARMDTDDIARDNRL